ncbi:MAG: hypothetical protein LBR98_07100, partial [Syntrophomonadaceae bacterium]|nr:hypothetical protein [Syntrophomonadaceae bacterium]
SPFTAGFNLKDGDQYLLCSDGLTDMVSLDEMEKVLRNGKDVCHRADELMSLALSGGGVDNITIILCELRKKRWGAKLT